MTTTQTEGDPIFAVIFFCAMAVIFVLLFWMPRERWAVIVKMVTNPPTRAARTYQICPIHKQPITAGDCDLCVEELLEDLATMEKGE